jgi:hypothetical protein
MTSICVNWHEDLSVYKNVYSGVGEKPEGSNKLLMSERPET